MQKLIICLLAILQCSFLQGNEQKAKIEAFLPGLATPLPLKLALPKDLIATACLPEETPNLFTGTLWATPETAEVIHKQAEVNSPFPKIKSGAFVAKLTPNIAQTGPDSFYDEENIAPSLKKMGFTNICVEKKRWGPYPVLSVQAFSKITPIAFIYLGLNDCGNNVLFIRYIFSENLKKDLKIWNAFVDRTQVDNR